MSEWIGSVSANAPAPRSGNRVHNGSAATWQPPPPQSQQQLHQHQHVHQQPSTLSFMSPLFHFTAHDTSIIAMEHNNHSKLLAISTSKNEIFVTSTRNMPHIPPAHSSTVFLPGGSAEVAATDIFSAPNCGVYSPQAMLSSPVMGSGQEWDAGAETMLVDQLRYPCTSLAWAPWQHGVYLACLCPGKLIRLYRFTHERWISEDVTPVQDCYAIAFSQQFTLACACSNGRLVILSRNPSSADGGWTHTSYTLPQDIPQQHAQMTGSSTSTTGPSFSQLNTAGSSGSNTKHSNRKLPKDLTTIAWSEWDTLLAVGDSEGTVRILFVHPSTRRLEGELFQRTPRRSGVTSPVRQVSWAPVGGRSFHILAIAYATHVHLLFCRIGKDGSARGGYGVNPGPQVMPTANDRFAQSLPLLEVLTSSDVAVDELTKISWNTVGTRFLTSHTDSSVRTMAVEVKHVLSKDFNAQARGDAAGADQMGSSGWQLKAEIRKVSVVSPYHGNVMLSSH